MLHEKLYEACTGRKGALEATSLPSLRTGLVLSRVPRWVPCHPSHAVNAHLHCCVVLSHILFLRALTSFNAFAVPASSPLCAKYLQDVHGDMSAATSTHEESDLSFRMMTLRSCAEITQRDMTRERPQPYHALVLFQEHLICNAPAMGIRRRTHLAMHDAILCPTLKICSASCLMAYSIDGSGASLKASPI